MAGAKYHGCEPKVGPGSLWREVWLKVIVALLLTSVCIPAAQGAGELTGSWGGLRPALERSGFNFGLTYIGETIGNLRGGIRRGEIYEDRFDAELDVDLQRLVGWHAATAHATVYQTDGAGPSARLVDNILDVSSIEARPSTRLFTFWLQQRLFNGRMSVRLGQLAMDDEFFVSGISANLVNATFGDPSINYSNMTVGGPIYPVAAPGLRVAFAPSAGSRILVGMFSGNPGGGHCTTGVQRCDPSGTTFSLSGGTLLIGELQYRINQSRGAAGLPGTYKIGAWHETGNFANQHFGLDAAGRTVSLASPSAVRPVGYGTDFALYGLADQMLWRWSGAADSGLSGFLRLGFAPAARNPVSFYADGGLSFDGLVPNRPDDIAILGIAYSRTSPAAARLDRDIARLNPTFPVRDFEAIIELSYLAQLRSWWTLQPDVQYVMHPGSYIPDPLHPAGPIGNALLIGLRTTVQF